MTVTTLHKMRADVAFQAFIDLVQLLCTSAGVEQPSLPRKRKVPRYLMMVMVVNFSLRQLMTTFTCSTLKQQTWQWCFIRDRLNQPGYTV